MPEIRMPVGGVTPPTPSSNQVSLYVKADKRFYMQDDTGSEVKLLTDESTLASLTTQLPLTDTGGANPTIAINNVTAITNGAMLATDKVKLDNATALNTADRLVLRDVTGNFAANEITANAFNGPATTCVTIPALTGEVTSVGNATTVASGVIDDDNIASGAAIAMTKLAVDPRLRSTHSGTQLANTISDFGTAIDNYLIANSTITNTMINASAAIDLSKLATDPLARANHTGTQLSSTISDFTTASNTAIGNYLTATPITNAEVDASAAIALSKLAVDPVARTNHTGTQLAATISDFNTAVNLALTGGNGIDVTLGTISVDGTAGRIDASGGTVDIDAAYVGQTSITTLGTVSTGIWNGNTVGVLYGGTGKTNPAAASNALLDVDAQAASVIASEDTQHLLIDATLAVRTITLPDITSDPLKFYIKKTDAVANNVVISADGSDTIEGVASISLTAQYDYAIIVSNASDNTWYIFGSVIT